MAPPEFRGRPTAANIRTSAETTSRRRNPRPEITTLAEMRARYPRTAIRAAREIGPARHDAATTIRIRDLAAQAQQAATTAEPEPAAGETGERLDELMASTPDEDGGWR